MLEEAVVEVLITLLLPTRILVAQVELVVADQVVQDLQQRVMIKEHLAPLIVVVEEEEADLFIHLMVVMVDQALLLSGIKSKYLKKL
jgi:phosphoribosyl-ATP pyrophosphohydrolase